MARRVRPRQDQGAGQGNSECSRSNNGELVLIELGAWTVCFHSDVDFGLTLTHM